MYDYDRKGSRIGCNLDVHYILSSDLFAQWFMTRVFDCRPRRTVEVHAALAIPSSSYGSSSTLTQRRQAPDMLSQYFSSNFQSICAVATWPPYSVLSPPSATQTTLQLAPKESQRYSFIKLIVHRPHPCPENPLFQVEFRTIELLGFFVLPPRVHQSTTTNAHNAIQPASQVSVPTHANSNWDDGNGVCGLRRVLLTTGLSDGVIQDLLDSAAPLEDTPVTTTDERDGTNTTSLEYVDAVAQAPDSREESLKSPQILDSLFDQALRGYLYRRDEQETLLDQSQVHVIPSETLHVPAIDDRCQDGRQRQRLEAIVAYTFGTFFSQCLVRYDDPELGVNCIQMIERFLPLLLEANVMPAELVAEASIALIVLSLRQPRSMAHPATLETFHAALHLTRTLFHVSGSSSTNPLQSSCLGIVDKLTKGQLNTGLRLVIESFLVVPHCWTPSVSASTVRTSGMVRRRQHVMDHEFQMTLEVLVGQDQTQVSTLRAFVPSSYTEMLSSADPDELAPSEPALMTLNRLQLLRWALKRRGCSTPMPVRNALRHYCESISMGFLDMPFAARRTVTELADECLTQMEVSESIVAKAMPQYALLTSRNIASSKQDSQEHTPLFVRQPVSNTQRLEYLQRIRDYFALHPRPPALYHQHFTVESLEGHEQEFNKGNVRFKGEVAVRELPGSSQRMTTTPFAFDMDAVKRVTRNPDGFVEIETAFAKFRGSVQER